MNAVLPNAGPPINVGVIGAGQIVEDNHLPTLSRRNDVTVRWVSDADLGKATRLARLFRTRAIPVTDIEAALVDVAVCLVAVPYGARPPYLEACATRGTAAYVEKPFARTMAEHDAWCARFPTPRLAVGYQRRFFRCVSVTRALVSAGTFGTLRRVSARIGAYAMKGGGGRYHTNPVLSGGGIVMELGVHLLDQVAFVTAATAVDLEAVTGVVENGLDHHVSCAGSLHVDGRVVPVDATVSRLQNMDGGVALRFDRGEVRFGVEPCSGVYLTQDGNPDVFRLDIQVNRSGLPTAQTAGRAFDAIWESFLGGLRRDEVTPAAAATGRITTQWVEAIYRGLPRG